MNASAKSLSASSCSRAAARPMRVATCAAPVQLPRVVARATGPEGLPSPGAVPVTRHEKIVDYVEKEVDHAAVVEEQRTKTVVDQVAREVERTEYVDVERKDVVVDQVEKEVIKTDFKQVPRTKEVVDEVQREVEVIDYVPVARKEIVTDEVIRQVAYTEEVPVTRTETVIEPVERVVSRVESVPITRKEVIVEEVPREVAYTEDVAVHQTQLKTEAVERVEEKVVNEVPTVVNTAVIPTEKLVQEKKVLVETHVEKVSDEEVLAQVDTVQKTNFQTVPVVNTTVTETAYTTSGGTAFSEQTNISGPGTGGLNNAEGIDKFSAEYMRGEAGMVASERITETEKVLVPASAEDIRAGRVSEDAAFVSADEKAQEVPEAVVEDMSNEKMSLGKAIKNLLS